MIARAMTKARRGISFGSFWDALAFTRVVTSNKERAVLIKYIQANIIEAALGRKSREKFLARRSLWELRLL